jgi:hypothetical protein
MVIRCQTYQRIENIEYGQPLTLTTKVALRCGAVKEGLNITSITYPTNFYMHLKDLHAHWDMIEGLKSRNGVEECSFNTIFGEFECLKIYASRKVAEKIEVQARYAAELYNVDISQDQRYLAEKDLFPCETENYSYEVFEALTRGIAVPIRGH